MDDASPKILVEFALLPAGKKKLQDFFDKNFEALQNNDLKAETKLQALLHEVLPKESQKSLSEMLGGHSEYALMIHNFPERSGLEKLAEVDRQARDAYCTYITNAIYRMNKVNPKVNRAIGRTINDPSYGFEGSGIHNDAKKGRFGALSAPYNAEHAPTKVLSLSRAVGEITPKRRKEIKVQIIHNGTADDYKDPYTDVSLEQLHHLLDNEHSRPDVYQVLPQNPRKPGEFEHELQTAIDRHSVAIDLQPGSILFLDEHREHHSAHPGTGTAPKGAKWRRIVSRTAGDPEASKPHGR